MVLGIAFAAGFTYLVCLYLGRALLHALELRMTVSEARFLGFLLGSALLSTLVFVLAALGFAYPLIFLSIGLAIPVLARRQKFAEDSAPNLPASWRWTFAAVYSLFAVLYLVNAASPECSPDGTAYHIGIVARYLREHRLLPITTDMLAALSQGVEMLFLFGFAFGRHSAAAMVHLLFLLALPWGILAFGRRFLTPAAGASAALLVFASPVAGRTGTSAYVDVALAAILFGMVYLLELWIASGDRRLLIPAGILAGFAFAAKYTAGLAVPLAIGLVVVYSFRRGKPATRPALTIAACGLALMLPWMCRNVFVYGNPVAPFANRWFPNPYFYVESEEIFSNAMRHFNGVTLPEIPMEAAVHGKRLQGFLGPVFLLSPLALIAAGNPVVRRLLLATLVFGLAYCLNIGTRFLIPILPFVSLAMAVAFTKIRYAAIAVTCLHAILAWPPVATRYTAAGAWRIEQIPWRQALRIEPEEDVLRRQMTDYEIGLMLDKHVPYAGRIFSVFSPQSAYHGREVAVAYKSALGHRLRDALWTSLIADRAIVWRYEFGLGGRPVQRIRVVQTAAQANSRDNWSITEIRASGLDGRIIRPSSIHASHNTWDARLAIDGNPVTRWRTWQAFEPGMWVELEFERREPIGTVQIDASRDQPGTRLTISGAREPLVKDQALPAPLAGHVARAYRAEGVHWALVHDEDYRAPEIKSRAAEFGFERVAESNGATLYRLFEEHVGDERGSR